MEKRLEILGEILTSYKKDIMKIMKEYYGSMVENIKEMADIEVDKSFDQKAKELDVKYEQIRMLRQALFKIDDLYRELMFVESTIQNIELEVEK